MVPLRVDPCESGSGWSAHRSRPHLILQDTTRDRVEKPQHTAATPRPMARRWETALFTTAAVVVLLFFLCSFVGSLWRASVVSYAGAYLPAPPVKTITITRGQTLWSLAERYGSPDKYILDRVEQIARFNHLSPNVPLAPGQRLRIPVTNPIEAAKLQQTAHAAFASS